MPPLRGLGLFLGPCYKHVAPTALRGLRERLTPFFENAIAPVEAASCRFNGNEPHAEREFEPLRHPIRGAPCFSIDPGVPLACGSLYPRLQSGSPAGLAKG